MTTFANGESGLSVRTKINNVLQHADGTAGELVINEAGADVDFRVESDTNANALFVDGATGNVGIGTSSVSSVFGTTVKVFSSGSGGTLDVGGSTVNARLFGSEGLSIAGFGTSTNHPFILFTNDTERMRLDASGNLGLGVTPSAWGSVFRAVQLGTASDQSNFIAGYNGAAIMSLGSGVYYDGSNYRYAGTTSGAIFSADQGKFTWSTAASGTAGNVATFTQAMTLDASGNLLIGTTSSAGSKLRISGLPTSSAGLSAGDVWNDGGTLKIA